MYPNLSLAQLDVCEIIYGVQGGVPQAVDVRDFVVGLVVYENILANCISGQIVLQEQIALADLLPLSGEEYLRVKFRGGPDQSDSYIGVWKLCKLTDRSWIKAEVQQYVLHFVSPEFITNHRKRISRAFRDQLASDAIRDIFTRDLQTGRPLLIDPSGQKQTFTIPNYTPFEAVNFFAARALTPAQDAANYFAYETKRGFHFKSLATLYAQAPLFDIVYRDRGLNTPANVDGRELAFRKAEDITMSHGYDQLNAAAQGLLRSKVVSFDIIRRTYRERDSRYDDDFTGSNHIDRYPLISRGAVDATDPSARIYLVPSSTVSGRSSAVTALDPSVRPNLLEVSVEKRQRALWELQQNHIVITLPGRTNVCAGDVVNVSYPSSRKAYGESQLQTRSPIEQDKWFSGPHLVTAIKHELVQQQGVVKYTTVLEVCRDARSQKLRD